MTELSPSMLAALLESPRGVSFWLAAMNLWTLALLLVAFAADRLLAKRVSASWRVALYAVVFIRLFIPATWSTPLSLFPGRGPASVAVTFTTAPVASTAPLVTAAAAPPAAASAPVEALRASPADSLMLALASIYAAVVLLLAARWLLALRALRRVADAAAPVRLAGMPPIVRAHATAGPMVVGVARPLVIIPAALLVDAPALELVLRHELAHVRRRDPLLAAALHAACVLAWPVLPLWLAAGRVRTLMEHACDARALAGRPAPERRRYAELLLAFADAQPARPLLARPCLTFSSRVAARVAALRGATHWSHAMQASIVTLVAALAAACAGQRSGQPALTMGEPPADAAVTLDLHILSDVTLNDAVPPGAPGMGQPQFLFADQAASIIPDHVAATLIRRGHQQASPTLRIASGESGTLELSITPDGGAAPLACTFAVKPIITGDGVHLDVAYDEPVHTDGVGAVHIHEQGVNVPTGSSIVFAANTPDHRLVVLTPTVQSTRAIMAASGFPGGGQPVNRPADPTRSGMTLPPASPELPDPRALIAPDEPLPPPVPVDASGEPMLFNVHVISDWPQKTVFQYRDNPFSDHMGEKDVTKVLSREETARLLSVAEENHFLLTSARMIVAKDQTASLSSTLPHVDHNPDRQFVVTLQPARADKGLHVAIDYKEVDAPQPGMPMPTMTAPALDPRSAPLIPAGSSLIRVLPDMHRFVIITPAPLAEPRTVKPGMSLAIPPGADPLRPAAAPVPRPATSVPLTNDPTAPQPVSIAPAAPAIGTAPVAPSPVPGGLAPAPATAVPGAAPAPAPATGLPGGAPAAQPAASAPGAPSAEAPGK